MKKGILLLAMVCCCFSVYSQTTTTTTTTTTNENEQNTPDNNNGTISRFYFGGMALVTVTDLDYSSNENGTATTKAIVSYGGGGFIGFNLSNNIGLEGEVLYQSLIQQVKFSNQNNEHKVKLRYVNIPLLLILNTGVSKPVNFNIAIGPQLGIKTGADVETSSGGNVDTVTAIVKVKPVDLGFAYGAGLDFRLAETLKLGIGFRGVIGLVDISDNSQSTTTNDFYILDRAKLKTYSGYASLAFTF